MKLFRIQLYNPWEPHIIVDGFGLYRIRVLKGLSWKYWDNRYFGSFKDWCVLNNTLWAAEYELGEAREFILKEKIDNKKRRIPDKVIHVK